METLLDLWTYRLIPSIKKDDQHDLAQRILERAASYVNGCRCNVCGFPGVEWLYLNGLRVPIVEALSGETDREHCTKLATQGLEELLLHTMAAKRHREAGQTTPHGKVLKNLGFAFADLVNLTPDATYLTTERLLRALLTENALLPTSSPYALVLSELFYEFTFDPWMLFFSQWKTSGRPGLKMDGQLAASLMFTEYPDMPLASLNAPWTHFIIYVPDQLLGPYTELQVRRVITDEVDTWDLGIVNPHGLFFQLGGTALDARLNEVNETDVTPPPCSPECTAHDHGEFDVGRLFHLAVRLFAGAVSLLNEPGMLAKQVQKRDGRPRWLRRQEVTGTYILGRDIHVNIDCRESVQAYLSNAVRNMRKIRFPVRGHKRWQPFGPGQLERKRIWLQPYWKGEKTAPMLVRTHVLKNPEPKVPP